MNTPKTLILIRHAHRDTDDRMKDNGLSDKGKDQVKKLLKFAKNRLDESEMVFFSSPKKRCIETVTPLAKEFKQEVRIEPRVNEHGLNESRDQYFSRMDEFLDFWKYECPEVTVVCSHGDWIPLVVQKLTGSKVGLKKAGWCEIEYVAGESFLAWLVQKHY